MRTALSSVSKRNSGATAPKIYSRASFISVLTSACTQAHVGFEVDGLAAPSPHTQVEMGQRAVAGAAGHRGVRHRVGQHTHAIGGIHLPPLFVHHGHHGVGRGAPQAADVSVRIEVRRVEDDQIGTVDFPS